jgi:hypothetical protein
MPPPVAPTRWFTDEPPRGIEPRPGIRCPAGKTPAAVLNRMYSGKKIIEWSPTFYGAFDTMVQIHDRYALDGRDPNTDANILWCFGLA